VRIIWYDRAGSALSAAGHIVAEYQTQATRRGQRGAALWRLEMLRPEPPGWLPGAPPAILAEADSVEQLGVGPLVAVAAFEGSSRSMSLAAPDNAAEPVAATFLEGELHTLAATRPASRLTLKGPADAVGVVTMQLAGHCALLVPTASLAAEGLALLRGDGADPPRPGCLVWPTDGLVEDAFVQILGQLVTVLLQWAPAVAANPAGQDPEPVHQMRVTIRRLRSALALFAPILAGPDMAAIKAGLKQAGTWLGPARDWDVFLAGTAQAVRAALPEDASLGSLMHAGEGRRAAHYAALQAYLADEEFRRLALKLAWSVQARPWRDAAQPPADASGSEMGLADFAAGLLRRRQRRLLAAGSDISDLPEADLHAIRLRGKQLRYACEFFAPLFPGKSTRRFIKRLAALQEELGRLNDGAVAARLLGEVNGPGAELARAQGIVLGYVTAGRSIERKRITPIWKKLRHAAAPTK
jgi:CHAD domain-containing protein